MSRRRKKPKVSAGPRVNSSTLVNRNRLAGLGGQQFNGCRNLYATFGYDQELNLATMRKQYERGDIAGRLIDAYPDATWREAPEIKGSDAFAGALVQLGKRFKLWSVLQRLDRLTQLGHYGVLLMGLDGGEPLSEPALQKNYKLIYLQPHGEQTARISKWEDDPKSPRFGKPLLYNIDVGTKWVGTGGTQKTITVHHSRVIHIAEDALEHECIGLPRLERVWNRLQDLEKLLGGSAEMYWQNVAMLLAFIADKDTTFAPDDKQAMEDQLEEMQHGLRRMLRLRGMEAKQLAPGLQGASPEGHIDKQLDMVAGASGIPKRILIGNEAGELASSQDETAWQGRVAERRSQFASPDVLEPLFRAGQRLGWLAEGEFEIIWPESDTLGEKGRAEVAKTVAEAGAAYVNTMGEHPVTEDEFRATLGYDPKPQADPEDLLDESDPDVQDAFDQSKRRGAPRPDQNDDNTPQV
jgi:hypothetical protein